jgi:UDP:flavonoid glycosyltransferase YjiC (YdhE family)
MCDVSSSAPLCFPPQQPYLQDVLGHPSTRLLVSHCGLHSIYEAAFHGVPVVGLPFMFEQVQLQV